MLCVVWVVLRPRKGTAPSLDGRGRSTCEASRGEGRVRYVEVDAHQHALASDIDVVERELVQRHGCEVYVRWRWARPSDDDVDKLRSLFGRRFGDSFLRSLFLPPPPSNKYHDFYDCVYILIQHGGRITTFTTTRRACAAEAVCAPRMAAARHVAVGSFT